MSCWIKKTIPEMNNSTVNFTTPETSTNSTTHSIGFVESLNICAYGINFLVGFPTHSYVIWLIITGTGSGVASEFFNLNLSVSEIGNSLNCLFFLLSIWFSSLFTLQMFLIGFSITARPLFQCLICVERYLAVVHPVTFLKFKPLRYRVICCTVIWIITLGSCLCCVFILVSFSINAHGWFLMLQFVLYLFIKLFCLVAVLRALKQVRTWREREREKGGKPCEEKSFLCYSYNYCEHGYPVCAKFFQHYLIIWQNKIFRQFGFLVWFVMCWLVLFSLFFICTGMENFPAIVRHKTLSYFTKFYFRMKSYCM